MGDGWSPAQYEKFRGERMAPFFDLLRLIRRGDGMRIVDLGCGSGELTAMLLEELAGASALGVDRSEAMLERARPRARPGLAFRLGDLADFDEAGDYDLVFSNAAFHWVPDNEALLRRLLSSMRRGAQVAVQLPRNEQHPSHVVASALPGEAPWRERLHGFVHRSGALELSRYAELLHEHGFSEMACFEKIYGHVLASSGEVVEWVKGTTLVPYLSRLSDEHQRAFLDAYRARLLSAIGDRAPYFFAFRRLLFWGEKS